MLPYMVILHLAQGIWFYSSTELFESPIFVPGTLLFWGFSGERTDVARHQYQREVERSKLAHPWASQAIDRATRANVAPILIFLVLFASAVIFSSVVRRAFVVVIHATPLKSVFVTSQLAEQEFYPPYTEDYLRWFPPT